MEILDNLFFIQRGFRSANHFAFRGLDPVLVDSGYLTDFTETERLLTRLGIRIEQVARIFTTHCHCDHIGGHAVIQERSGCDIALHRIGRHFIETRDDWATWWRYFDQAARFFTPTHTLVDGDTVQIGLHRFQALHTPGHSADGMVFYHPKEKILLSADALWERDIPAMVPRVEGSAALFAVEASLERLSALEVTTVYPGHGPPFTDAAGAIARSRQKVRACMADRRLIGANLLKKLIVYTVLMQQPVPEAGFLERLLGTRWFPETVDLYFGGDYAGKYEEILAGFLERNILNRSDGMLTTPVTP